MPIFPAAVEIHVMKHIGVLAHSAEGSALCYLTACHEAAKRLGAHMHPDITVSMIAMGASMAAWERLDLPPIRAILADTAARLAAAGCDFFVCPDNTAHQALEAPGEPFAIPGLHIADVVAETARSQGYSMIGVLGTKWLMTGPVYDRAFAAHGVAKVIPPPADRETVNRIIFDELCNGEIRDASRAELQRLIDAFADQGCDAVVLGCTEIPLIISPADSSLPTLDSTRLLAAAAVDAALGARAAPVWRGGPVLAGDLAAARM